MKWRVPGTGMNNVADPGCLSRIPDPTFFYPGSDFFLSRIPDPNCLHPGSRISIKEFKNLNPKKWFLSSRKYDPGCSSWIPDPDADFLPIPDPGVKKALNRGYGGSPTMGMNKSWISGMLCLVGLGRCAAARRSRRMRSAARPSYRPGIRSAYSLSYPDHLVA